MDDIKLIFDRLGIKMTDYYGFDLPALKNNYCVVIEEDTDKYTISFEIDLPKQPAINLYVKMVTSLPKEVKLSLTDDCFFVNDDWGNTEYVLFGEEARTAYYSQVYDLVNVTEGMEGDIVYH